MSQTAPLRDAVTLVIPPVTFCTDEFGSDEYWHCAIQYWTNPENHQVGHDNIWIKLGYRDNRIKMF